MEKIMKMIITFIISCSLLFSQEIPKFCKPHGCCVDKCPCVKKCLCDCACKRKKK